MNKIALSAENLTKIYSKKSSANNSILALNKLNLKVKQGEIIGTVGSSGRSTGPHLDVRLNWFGTRLDPATVLNIK